MISGATRLYGVIGDPVAHSFSPLIHNEWMAEAGLDAVYVPFHLTGASPASDIAALARLGCSGLNVTLPHKAAALSAASGSSAEARRIGAANTLRREPDGGWTAFNTDVHGFAYALSQVWRDPLEGAQALLIGAGGSARAALHHLSAAGARVRIANRTPERAHALALELCPQAAVSGFSDIPELSAWADVVINTASAGHGGGSPPDLAPGDGRPFLDLSYGRAAAEALELAGARGWRACDGLPMLVAQAAAAFEIWFGLRPDMETALARCRRLAGGGP